jgi:outer membrane protein
VRDRKSLSGRGKSGDCNNPLIEVGMRTPVLLAVLLTTAAGVAHAQSLNVPSNAPVPPPPPTRPEAGTQFTVGAGIGITPDYMGSDDYQPVPLWHLRADDLLGPTTYVDLLGLRLTSNLMPHEHLRLGPLVEVIRKRGSVDNDRVDDMDNVDPSVMLGITAGWDFIAEPQRGLGIAVDARGDVAHGHGFLVTPRLHGRHALGAGLSLSGSLSTTWASEDFMSDYFGVDGADARRSGLDEYDADSGFRDVSLGLGLAYAITPRFDVSLLGAYQRLVGDAEDSPIVDDEGNANQFFGGVLVNYRF